MTGPDFADTVTASIGTDDLHRHLPRRRTWEGVGRLATVHGRRLVGDWQSGPTVMGDLAGDVVALTWRTEPCADPVVDESAARLWLDRLWGDRDGRAVLCRGIGPFYTDTRRYAHRQWRQLDRWRWPADRERLLEVALTAAPTDDVYVGVLLHQPGTEGRRKATALPGRVAWADVDGQWTAQRQTALDRLQLDAAWQVLSGARGGRHVYVPLDRDVDRNRLESLNRRLCGALAADDGWSVEKVLRLPGTLNHKPRPLGGPAVPVRWL